MLAVLGTDIKEINNLLEENQNNYKCYIANDNSNGQIVISGINENLNLLIEDLKKKGIKNIKLPVSAPFHCKLMSSATAKMETIIKVILELGLCEIVYFKDLSHKISIAEYNKVSSSFLNKNEVGLINGILDKIANNIINE